jgi:mannose-6-phosphate isomerase
MAIALTPFLAFLNFLPLPTLLLHLLTVPELDDIIPSALRSKLASSLTLPDTQPADPLFFTATTAAPTDEQKAILKDIFEAFMTAEESKVKTAIASLVDRYTNGEVADSEKGLVDLVKMLNEQYPGDVGVLCVFILNVVELKKGEAAFLGASMPHAYISGGESSLGGCAEDMELTL